MTLEKATQEEIIRLVDDLNYESECASQENTCVSLRPFRFTTDGTCCAVELFGEVAWDSENDTWEEADGPHLDFIRKEISELLEGVVKLSPKALKLLPEKVK